MTSRSTSHIPEFNSESDRKRLQLLHEYHILNADLQDKLDGLVHLASEICDAPISLINLVDQSRQITKASKGWQVEEMPRESSFCNYTIHQGELFEIHDTEMDERFRESPLVQADPNIRFYAGAPLKTNEGYSLGALCVIDKKPRKLSEKQKKNLKLLANEVMARLEAHRETKDVKRKNEQLEKLTFFLDDSSDLQIIIDPKTLQIQEINPETLRIMGGSEDDFIGQTFGSIIADEQIREDVWEFLSQKKESTQKLNAPIIAANGEERLFELSFNLHDGFWYLTGRDKTEEIIVQKELNKRSEAMEASRDGIALLDKDFNLSYLNQSYAKKFGYKESESLLGKSWKSLHKNRTIEKVMTLLPQLESSKSWRGEITGIRRDGSEFPIEISLSRTSRNGYIAIIRDISERKETEQKLQDIIDTLRQAQKLAKLSNWKWVVGEEKMMWSEENYRIYDYDPATTEPTLENYFNVVHPEDIEKVHQAVENIRSGHQLESLRHRIITPQGTLKHVVLRATSYYSKEDGSTVLMGTTQDITEQVKIEEKLKQSLKEKEVLLSEVHHRVKNNLAVVSGLLQLEAFEAEDEELQYILTKCQMRIKSMANIHEHLYQHKDFSRVSFHSYILDLIGAISSAYSDRSENITINTSLDEVSLNINQAVPCGLIINELVVNAFKHAFQDQKEGEIKIILTQNNSHVILKVRDNGVGLAESFGLEKDGSLGMTLIKTLCNQLNTTLDTTSPDGTLFNIRFAKRDVKGSSSALR